MRILIFILILITPLPLMAQGFAASHTLPAGSIISEADLRPHEGKTVALSDPAQIIGLQARVTIYEGRPFQKNLLQQPVLVSRNQIVRLHYQRGGLRIVAEGRALEPGAAGDLIRIMNLDSRATITARVGEDGALYVSG